MNIYGNPSDESLIDENLVSVSPDFTEFKGVVQSDEFKADKYSAKDGVAYFDMTPSDTIDIVASNILFNGSPPTGTGDVIGPVSSSDNAITRFDGITGKLIQNSGVIINDTDDISGVGSIDSIDYKVSGNLAYPLRREDASVLFAPNTAGNISITDSLGIGQNVLSLNTIGTACVAIGNNAQSVNISGNSNVSVGNNSLRNNIGNSNCAFGQQAGEGLTTGDSNVLIGRSCHFNSTNLSSCVSIGQNNSTDGLTNCIQLGTGIATAFDNTAVIGNGMITSIINAGNGVCNLGLPSNTFDNLFLSGNIAMGSDLNMTTTSPFNGVLKTDFLNNNVNNNDLIMNNLFLGLDDLNNIRNTASIFTQATENWTNGVGYGSNIVFNTTDNASTSPSEKMRISSNIIMSTAVNMSSNRIINCSDPINPQDTATKNYVDSQSGSQPLWNLTFGCNMGTQADRYAPFGGIASDGNDASPAIRSYYYNIENPIYIVAWNLLRQNVSSNTNFYVEIETAEGTDVFTQTLLTSILVAENTQLKRSNNLSPLTIGAGCRLRVLINAGSANPQNCSVQLTVSSVNSSI